MVGFHTANIAALAQSNQILANGLQMLVKDVLTEVKNNLDQSMASAQSPPPVNEIIETTVKNSLAGYRNLVANSMKVTKQSWEIMADAMAPVTARMTDAAAILPAIATANRAASAKAAE